MKVGSVVSFSWDSFCGKHVWSLLRLSDRLLFLYGYGFSMERNGVERNGHPWQSPCRYSLLSSFSRSWNGAFIPGFWSGRRS